MNSSIEEGVILRSGRAVATGRQKSALLGLH